MNPSNSNDSAAAGRRERLAILAVTLAALVLRLFFWHTQSMVSADGTVYIRLARALAGGPALKSVQPPGYPFLILLFHWVIPNWILAARWVDLVAGLALVPLTWWVARPIISNTWLRLAPAAAMALLPLPVHLSLTTMSEAPYLAFLLLMFGLAGRRRWFTAGLAGGAAYAIRPEALTAVVVLALFRWRRPRKAAALLAGAALLVLPLVVVHGVQTGHWTLTAKALNIGAPDWRSNEPVVGKEAPASMMERIHAHGRESVSAYPRRFVRDVSVLLREGGWLAPVLALGALAGPAWWLAAGLVQLFITPFFALGRLSRLILPLLPFAWLLAAAFLDRLRGRWMPVVGGVCVVGLAVTAVAESPQYHRTEDGFYPELVETGKWLRPHVDPQTVVYGRKPFGAFYAGASYREIPLGSYDEILNAIVRQKGDFLIVDQAVVDFFRPQLLPLVMDKGVIGNESRLKPVYINGTYRDRRTILYRVVRPGGPGPFPDEREIRKKVSEIDHGPNHLFHGILAMRAKRWQVAAGEFAYAIMADTTDAVAYNNRAWCLLKAGLDSKDAERTARKAVALDPQDLDYLDTLVEVLKARGKTAEAATYEARMDSLRDAGARQEEESQ